MPPARDFHARNAGTSLASPWFLAVLVIAAAWWALDRGNSNRAGMRDSELEQLAGMDLAEAFEPAEAQAALAADAQQDQQNAVAAAEPRIAELNALAEKAKALADKQDELQQQAEAAPTEEADAS